jgi:hypothetical protein
VHQLKEAIALQRNFVIRWRGRLLQLNLVARTPPENHQLALFLAHEQLISNLLQPEHLKKICVLFIRFAASIETR